MNTVEKDLENKIKMNQVLNNDRRLQKAKLILAIANLTNKAKNNTTNNKNSDKMDEQQYEVANTEDVVLNLEKIQKKIQEMQFICDRFKSYAKTKKTLKNRKCQLIMKSIHEKGLIFDHLVGKLRFNK